MNLQHRMPRRHLARQESDDSAAAATPPARKSKSAAAAAPRKRRSRGDDDDDSVDSRGNIRGLIDYDYDSSSSTETTSDEEYRPPRAAAVRARKRIAAAMKEEEREPKPRQVVVKPRRQVAVQEESEEEEAETEETDDEYMDEEEEEPKAGIVRINIGSFGADEGDDPMVPKRHNMKKEPEIVKKFVELVTKPMEDVGIDAQIDQFKAMDEGKQKTLIEALERRPTVLDTGAQLMFKILMMKLSPEVQAMTMAKYQALQNMDPSTTEYFKQRNWLDKFCAMPFGTYKELPVRIEDGHEVCGQFMAKARSHLDAAVYGQEEAKLQILQFIASKVANPTARGLSLLLIGPPGIGKTSLIKGGIAKAIDWPFQFISLGGDSDASTYTGHQLVYESSHAGKIVNSLVSAKSMSMVLMFDEVDKISQTPKGEEVANLLIHLTDPVQNGDFEDKYLAGVPIDLSKVMFVFSANDINKIDKVLLDRMNVIQLQGYSAKDKIIIAEQYLLPAALKEVNLSERIGLSKEVLTYMIETYAADETGVRELKRCIESVVQKINMLRMYNAKELPFYIKDFALPFVVKKEHIDLFLKKREGQGGSKVPLGMYI